jgi:hypothetical protein
MNKAVEIVVILAAIAGIICAVMVMASNGSWPVLGDWWMGCRLSTEGYSCTDVLCRDPSSKFYGHSSKAALSHVEVFYYPSLSFWNFPEWIAAASLWTLVYWSAILIGFKKFEEWTREESFSR